MPGPTDLLEFPKARLSIGPGDLIDVFDVALAVEDGRKLVQTLRANPAGFTGGAIAGTLTFKAAISRVGFERDYWGPWERKEVVQARLKIPGATLVINGPYTKPQITGSVDNFIEFQVSVIGKPTKE